MSDQKPRKRAESLAVENVKRIADVLRSERNDAIALAQVKRQEADQYRAQLENARAVLDGLLSGLSGQALDDAKACLSDIDEALSATS